MDMVCSIRASNLSCGVPDTWSVVAVKLVELNEGPPNAHIGYNKIAFHQLGRLWRIRGGCQGLAPFGGGRSCPHA
jgi:hypothetical protein